MKEENQNLAETQGEKAKRNVSKTTVMHAFRGLVDRIEQTELLTKEEVKQLEKLKNKALENFMKSF